MVPIERSCGEAASRQASRSASGTSGSTSSSASIVPAPIVVPWIPRGTTPRMSTSVSPCTSPSRSSGTSSVPPASSRLPLPPPTSSRLDGCRSSTLLPLPRLGEGAQHLLPRDRQRAHVGAGRVADRVHDRRGGGDDRRLAEPLRAEVRQVLVRDVEQV